MTLKQTLDEYLSAQKKWREASHNLKEATSRLVMECRKMSSYSDNIIDSNLKKLATILLSKIQ